MRIRGKGERASVTAHSKRDNLATKESPFVSPLLVGCGTSQPPSFEVAVEMCSWDSQQPQVLSWGFYSSAWWVLESRHLSSVFDHRTLWGVYLLKKKVRWQLLYCIGIAISSAGSLSGFDFKYITQHFYMRIFQILNWLCCWGETLFSSLIFTCWLGCPLLFFSIVDFQLLQE